MYTKQQLESMDVHQLMDIAYEYGIKVSQDDPFEDIIYAILDRAAENVAAKKTSNQSDDTPKRKRARISKDTDKVYTVSGKESENFDIKNQRAKKGDNKPASLFDALTDASLNEQSVQALTPQQTTDNIEPATTSTNDVQPAAPKKRGRKSKAEKEAMERARLEQEAAQAANQSSEDISETSSDAAIDDASETNTQPSGADMITDDKSLIEQLQEKIKLHNTTHGQDQLLPVDEVNAAPVGVWEGDPGDGTDFITIVDLPIEDTSATPMRDIFDRPTSMHDGSKEIIPTTPDPRQARFDFSGLISGNGVLEIMQDGYGFLRSSDYNYLSSPDDIYLSPQQIKNNGLKTGDVVECTVRPPRENEKYFAVSSINSINGRQPSEVRDRIAFEHLTPLFPDEKFNLCGDRATSNPSVRIVDLFSPIGKGQRALIVAQPKTGKTILMKDIANAIAANHPEAYLMMLLIDERPEEVTDMSRTVNAEVIASTFDEPAERHVKIAGIVLEKAKRMVECGHDVVIFLDSITRLARAYNTVAPASGKVLTGGVDANALQKPKRFFGAARNIEGGGSLTIIATALIDTGSKMDEVIFEEFKGTGNMELQLDRSLSNKRIFPAINLVQSSTRRDDLLQDQTTQNRMWIVRKFISDMNAVEAMNTIRDRLVNTTDNDEFLLSMNG